MSGEAIGTAHEFFAASFRAVQAPHTCTARDFAVLDSTNRDLADRARVKAAEHARKAADADQRRAAAQQQARTAAALPPVAQPAASLPEPRDEHEATYRAAVQTADGKRPITHAFLCWILHGIGTDTKAFVEGKIATLVAENAALTARIAELEQRPQLKDGGVWRHGQLYQPGDIVSHGGAGWICSTAHVAAGQLSHECFRLLVKAGRDGRDAKKDV